MKVTTWHDFAAGTVKVTLSMPISVDPDRAADQASLAVRQVVRAAQQAKDRHEQERAPGGLTRTPVAE